ncbi:MAG: hypothetical protein O9353_01135, partial [Bacteroidia bacterium]|nr:hypothetical protein [Bacteroidia bacterium]
MSFDKQIQDKFSGFEPEVPDEQVDAGWEEIRYFLPSEEKKKRGFFFYRLNGMGISIVALLALTIASSIMLLLMKHGKKNSTLTALQRTSPTLRPANSEQAATHHTASASHPETNSGLEAALIEASAVGTKQKSYMSVTQRSVKSLSVNYQNTNRSAFSGVLGNTRHAKQAKPGINNSIQNLTATSIHNPQVPTQPDSIQNLLHRSGNTLAFMMLIKPAVLDGEAPFSPELNPEPALLSVDRIDPLPSNKRKPALELFAGLSNRSLLLQAEQDKKALQAAGFSTGIAGIFPVRSRFYLSGQFIVSHNPIKQRVEASVKEIIKKE